MESIKIDFIEINCDKDKINEQIERLIRGEIEEIDISNMPSYKIEELYKVKEITDFNGWQCDWWSTMSYKGKTLKLFGCAWNAYVEISIDERNIDYNDDDLDDDEQNNYKSNCYDSIVKLPSGSTMSGILPVKDGVSLEKAEELVKNTELEKYYVWRTNADSYSLVYAPNEAQARFRMIGIWGQLNEIANEKEFERKCEWYKKHPVGGERIKFSGQYYVLDAVVYLTKEKTLDYLKGGENITFLDKEELTKYLVQWKGKHGYADKIIELNYDTVKEYLRERYGL